ncbi:MAG: hypothetical protein TEF_00130 [Rhizobiales bacterium NRL2]|nr:MAG: hypothetical protein TEF_00130 [Rhizobiales bacterium NRL2]
MRFLATWIAHLALNVRPWRGLLDTALRMDGRNAAALGGKLRYGLTPDFRVLVLLAAEDRSFAEVYRAHARDSRAQLLQDLVQIHLCGAKRDGYFVEIGVGNGVDFSNSYLFETALGWRGLLVEPNPDFHAAIRDCRTARLATEAAFDRSGGSVPFLKQSAGEMSGIADFTKKRRKGSALTIDVPTIRTDELFAREGVPAFVDFLSVDTEGTEFEILSAVDFEATRFGFIAVEHNHREARRRKVIELLESKGYRRVLDHISQFDDWFVPA